MQMWALETIRWKGVKSVYLKRKMRGAGFRDGVDHREKLRVFGLTRRAWVEGPQWALFTEGPH